MLGDQVSARGDQRLGGSLLFLLVVPGAGELHLHLHVGADSLGAKVEAGVAGNHFRIGEGADITHHGNVALQLAGGLELIQLHSGGDTGQIAAFIDRGESVVEVRQTRNVSVGAGRMAEFHIRLFLSSLLHETLMTETVGENDLAAFVSQVQRGFIAVVGLADVPLDDHLVLFQAQSGSSVLHADDEVVVVGGIFIMQQNDAQFDVLQGHTFRNGDGSSQGQYQSQGKYQSNDLLHVFLSSSFLEFFYWISRRPAGERSSRPQCRRRLPMT